MSEDTHIAIIGLGARLPDADDVFQFWRNLRIGRESIRRFTRTELLASGEPPEVVDSPDYVPAAAIVEHSADFDAAFFAYSEREAAHTDPQHRLFLEASWSALELAGYGDRRHPLRVGVFASCSTPTFDPGPGTGSREPGEYMQAAIGREPDFLCTRVSYKLNLTGPGVCVQTACSSSLVAVHLAAQSLLYDECDSAIAGGVSLHFPERSGYLYQQGGILSADGHCRPYDAAAEGTVRGSGAGVVVLKRLSEALAAGDHIWAVLRGSAVNNDGRSKVGYTAPSVAGQSAVIAEAHSVSDVDPTSVGYVEGHGTATRLGDPIELAALNDAFGLGGASSHETCLLGSVKGNVGHLDAAAAMPSLIKAIFAVHSGEVPGTLHFCQANPECPLADGPFRVTARTEPWPQTSPRRIAGVSSFGIGGTNVHAVIEQPPDRERRHSAPGRHLLLISARSEAALMAQAARLADCCEDDSLELSDVEHTLATGRTPFEHRGAVVADSSRQARDALRSLRGRRAPLGAAGKVAFLFPGQGAQRPGMASGVYRLDREVAHELDTCIELLAPLCDFDLRSALIDKTFVAEELQRTSILQPTLFALELALARVWLKRGLCPTIMLGHSLGELTAACVSGVFSPSDAAAFVTTRGQLMERTGDGSMLAVALTERELAARLPKALDIAACNAPSSCVVTGAPQDIVSFHATLEADAVAARALRVGRAFHSRLLEPILQPLHRALEGIALHPPSIPFISNVTGRAIADRQATSPTYWVEQARRTVRFSDGVEQLLEHGPLTMLEVGPGRTLAGLVRSAGADTVPIATLADGDSDLLPAIGELWSAGVELERPQQGARPVPLPTYQFERRPLATVSTPTSAAPAEAALRLAIPTWRESADAPSAAPDGHDVWQLVGHAESCEPIAQRLSGLGQQLHLNTTETLRRQLTGGDTALKRLVVFPDPDDAARRQLESVIDAIRLADETVTNGSLALDVVTAGACEVLGADTAHPAGAMAHAAAHVAAQELGVSWRALDLPADITGGALDALAAKLIEPPRDAVLAWRRGHWWRQDQVELAPATEQQASPLRRGGRYLITGGGGGLAYAIAGWLHRTADARVALLARSLHDRHEAVARLQAEGVNVLALRADVTVRGELQAALKRARAELGPLNGVFHAAGEPAASRRIGDPDSDLRALHAKVTGTELLCDLLHEDDLDFLCLCSSLASVAGGAGEVDYVAANAYLDAVAASRSAAGRRTVSIDWDAWSEAGMARRAAATASAAFRDHVRGGLTSAHALAALGACLSLGVPRVLVSAGPLRDRLRTDTNAGTSTNGVATRVEQRVDPNRQSGDSTPAGVIASVYGEVLGLEAVRRDDDFFDLGGSSLLALQLAARLRRRLGCEVGVDDVLNSPSPASLALMLSTTGAAAQPDTAAQKRPPNIPVLVCLPFAGGGASAFEPWRRALAGRVDVHPLGYPGRDGAGTPPARRMDDLVELLLGEIEGLAQGAEFAIFGHSLGALVGYEITRRLRREGGSLPSRLIMSAAPAPHTLAARPALHGLTDAELISELRQLGGVPPTMLESSEFTTLMLPALRADLEVYGTYEYRPEAPLDVPIFAIGGRDDDAARSDELLAWSEHTSGGFQHRLFTGGHFFIDENREAVLDLLTALLAVELMS